MGLFSKDTKKKAAAPKKVVAKTDAPKAVTKSAVVKGVASDVLRNPRITEKAAHISDNNVYTFDISPRATKTEIMKAIKDIYKVSPIKVNVAAIPKKGVFRRNTLGVKGGGRKAYVFLKKGDKIEFI